MSGGGADTGIADAKVPHVTFERLRRLLAYLSKPLKFLLGVLSSLTPLSAVILMGWLTRLSELKTIKFLVMQTPDDTTTKIAARLSTADVLSKWPNWFAGNPTFLPEHAPTNSLSPYLGGLSANITMGLKSLFALAILTLPFSTLWLLGWWSGWQNSFTKGYENAFAGPVISIIGIAIALISLSYLPMAWAHFSLERRISAFFEIGRVLHLVRVAGWRYLLLALCYVFASLPIFFATVSPIFIEQMRPDILSMAPDEIEGLRGGFHFWTSVYLVAAHIFLTSLGARIYARSLTGLHASDRQEWNELRLIQIAEKYAIDINPVKKPLPGMIPAAFMAIFLAVIWFGFVAQIYVGQFMNYKWWSWLNHPLIQIPWFPPLGPWN